MADSDWDPRKAARAACLAHGDVAVCYVSSWHKADMLNALALLGDKADSDLGQAIAPSCLFASLSQFTGRNAGRYSVISQHIQAIRYKNGRHKSA